MASYTAALFETLRQPTPAAAPAPAAPYDGSIARGVRVAALASAAPAAGGAHVPVYSAAMPRTPTAGAAAPSGDATAPAAAAAPLPRELEDCYAVIRFQRGQVAQLRARCATLEEQVGQVRLACAGVPRRRAGVGGRCEGGARRHAACCRPAAWGCVRQGQHGSHPA